MLVLVQLRCRGAGARARVGQAPVLTLAPVLADRCGGRFEDRGRIEDRGRTPAGLVSALALVAGAGAPSAGRPRPCPRWPATWPALRRSCWQSVWSAGASSGPRGPGAPSPGLARLADGAVGRARCFDLAAYVAARRDDLALLSNAVHPEDHTVLFRATEGYRAGAEGKDKTEQLLRALYSLLEDLMFLHSGAAELVRNRDIAAELKRLAADADFDWIALAAQRMGEVESGMRRNLLRSLSLDAMVTSLERG